MKKRLLALALAGTTAFSVFGMNAFAATDNEDAFGYETYTAKASIDFTDLSKVYTGTLADAMEDGFDSKYTYLFDFVVGDSTKKLADVVEAIDEAVLNDEKTGAYGTDELYTAAVNAIDARYDMSDWETTTAANLMSGDRDDAVDLIKDIKKNLPKVDLYDAEEWADYEVEALITAIKDVDYDEATSYLGYLAAEYNRIFAIVEPSTSMEEKYDEAVEKAEGLVDSDYTAKNWLAITRLMEDAELLAEDGKYADAIAVLDSIYTTVQTIKPVYTDLKKALDNADKIYAAPADYDASVREWSALEDAVDAAVEVYNKCKVASSRKYVGQSVVDEVTADLEAALSVFVADYDAVPAWVVLKLETAIDDNDDYVDTDYRTNSSYFRAFEKALAEAEKVLDKETATVADYDKAEADLVAAAGKLHLAQKAVPASMNKELNNLLKEVTFLMDEFDENPTDISAGQYKAMADALKKEAALDGDSKISEVAAAIEALEAAITYAEPVLGWVETEKGWAYGTEEGFVKSGWYKVKDNWCWFEDGIAVQSSWRKIDGTWYYLNAYCFAARGWAKVDGKWYFFNDGCAMLHSTTVDGYVLDASGAWVE